MADVIRHGNPRPALSLAGSSHGPRAEDPSFDPQLGDWLTIGDDEEPPLRARVVRRDTNLVWVQLDLSHILTDATSATALCR